MIGKNALTSYKGETYQLPNDSHEAVDATDKQSLFTGKADGGIEARKYQYLNMTCDQVSEVECLHRLEVLNDADTRKFRYSLNKAGECDPFDILPRKQLRKPLHKRTRFDSFFKKKLLLHLSHFSINVLRPLANVQFLYHRMGFFSSSF